MLRNALLYLTLIFSLSCSKSNVLTSFFKKSTPSSGPPTVTEPSLNPEPFPYYARVAIEGDEFPQLPATGDFNQDGRLDLVYAVNENTNAVFVYLADKKGLFQDSTRIELFSETGLTAPAVGDFDNDGHDDIAICSETTNLLTIFLGAGNGSLTQVGLPTPSFSHPMSLYSADFDQDGFDDLALTRTDWFTFGAVTIFLSNGDGTFATGTDYTAGVGAYTIAIGDIDGIKGPDFVTANFFSNSYTPYLNDGTGHFTAGTEVFFTRWILTTHLADVDNDQRLDLLINGYDRYFRVSLGNGDGTFQTSTLVEATPSSYPENLIIDDLNNDGNLDVLTPVKNTHRVGVNLGNGDGTFQTYFLNSYSRAPKGAFTHDFNADGLTDFFSLSDWDLGNGIVLLGKGDGTFHNTYHQSTESWSSPRQVVAYDFDNDGDQDLAITRASKSDVALFLNPGDGQFGSLASQTFVGVQPHGLAACDFNSDGKMDLITANTFSLNFSLLAGDGVGGFSLLSNLATGFGAWGGPKDLICLDIDHDGHPDIAAIDPLNNSFFFMKGDGAGSFASAVILGNTSNPAALAAADLNGDQILDFVVTSSSSLSLELYLSTGGVSYSISTLALPSGTYDVLLEDINGDEKADIITTNYIGKSLSLYPGEGNGAFGSRIDIATHSFPRSVAAYDLNGDGRKEVVVNFFDRSFIELFEGNDTNNVLASLYKFRSRSDTASGTSPAQEGLLIKDLNGDGVADLLSIASSGGMESFTINFGRLDLNPAP